MLIATLGLAVAVSPAFAVKACEELKTEIAAKLDAKGVKSYQLDIVASADVKDQTVVGSCEGGTKKITYQRGEAAKPEAPAKPAAAPKSK
jgi:hypothetical protein